MPFWSSLSASSSSTSTSSYKKTDQESEHQHRTGSQYHHHQQQQQQIQKRSIYEDYDSEYDLSRNNSSSSNNNNNNNSGHGQSIYSSHLLDQQGKPRTRNNKGGRATTSSTLFRNNPDDSNNNNKNGSTFSSSPRRDPEGKDCQQPSQHQHTSNVNNDNKRRSRKMVLPKVTKRGRSYLKCSTIELLLVLFLLIVAIMIVVMFMTVATTTTTPSTTTTTTTSTTSSALRVRQGVPSSSSSSSSGTKYHVVFSTSCSYSHDWQSYLFYFHAMLHEQPGDVTRIVSGCSDEDEVTMTKMHEEQFSIMNPNFLIHFTPEFGKQLVHLGFNYQQTKYWNKPFGLRHWLQHRFGYSWDPTGKDTSVLSTPYDNDIIILVDPDMLMQRPFINDFSTFPESLWTNWHRKNTKPLATKVEPGKPIAQDYSFGAQWLTSVKHNLTYVVGPDSPVHHVTTEEAVNLYSAGPPYWFTAKDGFLIAQHWAEFLPRLFEVKPVFMAEMYGYCMAAAHLGLKHQLARGFMVSNVEMYDGEGWPFLDNADGTTCDVSQFQKDVPFVIHFCQRYSVGEFFINKYLFPHQVLSCDHPMLELPPLDIVSYTNYSYFGDGTLQVWEGWKSKHIYKHAFMVCSLMPALNKAAEFYKDHHCPNGSNRSKTYNHFRSEFYEKDHGKFHNKFHPEPFTPRT